MKLKGDLPCRSIVLWRGSEIMSYTFDMISESQLKNYIECHLLVYKSDSMSSLF